MVFNDGRQKQAADRCNKDDNSAMLQSVVSISRAPTKLTRQENRKPRLGRQIIVRIVFGLAIAVAPALAAPADQPPDHHGRIIFDKVWATAAEVGDRSKLRFRLVNQSYDPVYLLGVDSPVATHARIVARISDRDTTTIESVAVRADSELDLNTSHMWIELGPLARPIKPGESIPIELIFVRSRVRVYAHVHGADS